MEQKTTYGAENIKVLAGREAVRARPGMYIGDTTLRGLHHLVYEAVDNSIDEALAGYCSVIKVVIHTNGSVSVEDDGRGIPVENHPQLGKSALTIVMTMLHAGGKFDKKTYKVSGGLHGVGISVTNFLSEWLEVWVKRDGKLYFQRFERGKPASEVESRGETQGTGTKVVFIPDHEIFPDITFHFDILSTRMRELAFLNKGITVALKDERDGKESVFKYTGGLSEFVNHLNKNKQTLHPIIYFMKQRNDIELEIAMQYTTSYQENIFTFANNINTHEGGTHLSGFKSALTRVINAYMRQHNGNGKKDDFSGEDVREGLTVVISVKVPNPQFEGQTKTKLGNGEIAGIVNSLVVDGLGTYMEEHPAEARLIISKCDEALRAREAARKAKELARKGVFEGGSLPGKLADCSNRDPAKCEVFIVEGDSAGGCFSGDTKVALTDGRNVSFKKLVEEHNLGKINFCYTIKEDWTVGVEEIRNPRITKRNAAVIKITLDDGEEMVCTPNHRFMLRDGTYKEAQHLSRDISLMPLQRQLSKLGKRITIKGYEMVYDNAKHRWIFTHLLSDAWNIAKCIYSAEIGPHRHHIDFRKLNNNPTNITRLTGEGHLQLHRDHISRTMHTEEAKEKCRKLKRTQQFREMMSKRMKEPKTRRILSRQAQEQWKDQAYKKYMGETFLKFYHSNSAYRKINNEMLNKNQKEYWSKKRNREKQSDRVKKYFEEYPEKKRLLSNIAKKQWGNRELKRWRSNKTKEQWTPAFRSKRKEAYNKTYFRKTINALREVYEFYGDVDPVSYDELRRKRKDKTLLRLDTFAVRYFEGNLDRAYEAVENYNHKIQRIEHLSEHIDVYDIEVPHTHNFALASGVFVHNSAKQGRSREFQAILPLRGKILNVEKARLHKVFENTEIRAMITAIGTGVQGEFDIQKARYHKIIIATDADVDGSHIRTLLLTFFYRYMKDLVEAGYVYIAQPPLYKIKNGKQVMYAYSDREKAELMKTAENMGVQRYKGLGEMNPGQLWETTMDPAHRILKQVTIEDGVEADRMFTLLMGEEVEPRRDFIMEHAKDVVNLDV